MTARILVVGDANVDLVLRGDVVPRFGQAEQLLDAADLVLGGSASIVASGLAKLGVPTSLVAVVGDDEFGRFTRSALAGSGVETGWVRVDATEPTGISVILSAGDRAILTLPGTIGFTTAAEVRAAVTEIEPAHVHFASYFLLPGLAAELPELLGWLRVRGITTSLDTNWDPARLWTGLENVLPLMNYLFPNSTELLALAEAMTAGVEYAIADDAEPELAAAMALTSTGATVVVKAGAAGGWSRDAAGEIEWADGLTVNVIDTTGAGDSFDAGFLAAIAHGVDDAAERLRWATAAGSLSTLAPGGTAGQATLSRLRAALAESNAAVR